MSAASLEVGRSFLQKVDENGVSLHGHLTEVLAWILTAQPENALDALLAVRTEGRWYGMYGVWAVYVYSL